MVSQHQQPGSRDAASSSGGKQGDAASFSAAGGAVARSRKVDGRSGAALSAGMKEAFAHAQPHESTPPASSRAARPHSSATPSAAAAAPFDVLEFSFEHPLSKGSTLGHDPAEHSRLQKAGQAWRAQPNPLMGGGSREFAEQTPQEPRQGRRRVTGLSQIAGPVRPALAASLSAGAGLTVTRRMHAAWLAWC